MLREIIERFAGRYQIWRDEQRTERGGREKNPLTIFALAAAAFVVWNVYTAVSSHDVDWRMVESSAFFIAFLVLYLWRPQWAWIMFLIWGASMVVESPSVYTLQPRRYPPNIRLISACFLAAMGMAVFGYGFIIRNRYQSYRACLEDKKSPGVDGEPTHLN